MKIYQTFFVLLFIAVISREASCFAQVFSANTNNVPAVSNQLHYNARQIPPTSPAEQKAAAEVRKLSQELFNAKDHKEKEPAKSALEKALTNQFELDIERRRKELDAIKQRVAEMESLLEKRITSKEEIVGLRLKITVNNANGLGWHETQQNVPWSNNNTMNWGGTSSQLNVSSSSLNAVGVTLRPTTNNPFNATPPTNSPSSFVASPLTSRPLNAKPVVQNQLQPAFNNQGQ